MNTGFGVIQVSLRFVIEPSDHSVSNHRLSSRRVSGVSYAGLTGPPCGGRPLGAVRHLGFAIALQARHDSRPNRVHLRYGLNVHLRLLPTPPRGDAVTFGYRPESACPKGTSTPLTKHTCRRTRSRLRPAIGLREVDPA